jgi:hypothetical protein
MHGMGPMGGRGMNGMNGMMAGRGMNGMGGMPGFGMGGEHDPLMHQQTVVLPGPATLLCLRKRACLRCS